MNWTITSRIALVAALFASLAAPAMAQDSSAQCWVNTGTGKGFGGPGMPPLPDGLSDSGNGMRSGAGHQFAPVPCPPPGAQAAPPPRRGAAATPEQ